MVGTSKQATPPSHLSTDDPHLDWLLNPARFYKHPRDVIDDRRLGLSEKRAILSSWASDALRRLDDLARPPGKPPASPAHNPVCRATT